MIFNIKKNITNNNISNDCKLLKVTFFVIFLNILVNFTNYSVYN